MRTDRAVSGITEGEKRSYSEAVDTVGEFMYF